MGGDPGASAADSIRVQNWPLSCSHSNWRSVEPRKCVSISVSLLPSVLLLHPIPGYMLSACFSLLCAFFRRLRRVRCSLMGLF